jgi:hypothetical protein
MRQLTPTGMKRLKKKTAKAYEEYKKLYDELHERCTCPKEFMVTLTGYETDTLGCNGTNWYQDKCSVCGKYDGKEYGGVYGGRNDRANYREVKN